MRLHSLRVHEFSTAAADSVDDHRDGHARLRIVDSWRVRQVDHDVQQQARVGESGRGLRVVRLPARLWRLGPRLQRRQRGLVWNSQLRNVRSGVALGDNVELGDHVRGVGQCTAEPIAAATEPVAAAGVCVDVLLTDMRVLGCPRILLCHS